MTERTKTPDQLRLRALSLAVLPFFALSLPAATTPTPAMAEFPHPTAVASDSTDRARGYLSDHVIVISIDGLRPDAIAHFGAPTLERLMRHGSYTLEAQTIMPSKTLPSHTSMLTGTEPEQHGVTWNSEKMDEHGHVATPTIFAAAKKAGFHTAAFFSKSKFEHLAVPGTLDYSQAPGGWLGKYSADRTIDDAERYLERHRPNLMFVHVGEPDFAGHLMGWMSTPYGWAVREADSEIGELLRTAERVYGPGNYTVIVTADHGGHDRGHGTSDARDTTIPWIVWGRGVAPGTVLEPGVRTMDTAATALGLHGIRTAVPATGVAVRMAFEEPFTPVVAELAGGR
jgi:predicted AlkP superfamily pyrophosphatase or phosphodiesterase